MIEARFNGNYEEKNITNKVKNMLFSRKNQFEQTRQENKCEWGKNKTRKKKENDSQIGYHESGCEVFVWTD